MAYQEKYFMRLSAAAPKVLAACGICVFGLLIGPVTLAQEEVKEEVKEAQQDAAATAAEDSASSESTNAASQTRAGHQTSYAQRGKRMAALEQVQWIGPGEQYWYVTQTAQYNVVGNVLLLSDQEPNGAGHLAQLRLDLASIGWHTHYLSTAGAPVVEDWSGLINAALATLPAAEKLFVVCEAQACMHLVNAAPNLTATGLVFINLPYEGVSSTGSRSVPKSVREELAVFKQVPVASLILQEFPYRWPVQQPLGADVELHLLPKSSARAKNGRVLRKLRGWLKRRHQLS